MWNKYAEFSKTYALEDKSRRNTKKTTGKFQIYEIDIFTFLSSNSIGNVDNQTDNNDSQTSFLNIKIDCPNNQINGSDSQTNGTGS